MKKEQTIFEDRTRVWLHKPLIHSVPVSAVRIYLNQRLAKLRKEYSEFDSFLIEVGELLKKENNNDYLNIIRLIEGDAESNWISPSKSLLTVLIKLFNLCLSPKQAVNYIKECYQLYCFMNTTTYRIDDEYEVSIRRSRWDSKPRKFINILVIPNQQIDNWDNYYWFNITFSDLVIEDYVNDIVCQCDTTFEIRNGQEKFEDTLMLFVYYQYKDLLRNIFNTVIKRLKKLGIIKLVSKDKEYESSYQYEIPAEVGRHEIIKERHN